MILRRNKPILIAIIASILIIVISFWFVNSKSKNELAAQAIDSDTQNDLTQVRDIEEDDHVLGNPEAPIVFFVYSDFSCSYCKSYHETMRTLLNLYGQDGEVAWVFRHIPYVQLHPESPMYAIASECVAQEAGDTGFWKFTDELYEQVDPLTPLGAAELVIIAEYAGATRQSFVSCMRSNKLMAEVEKDFTEAISAGAKGSPFTVVQTPTKRSIYQGAQDFRTLAVALQTSIRSLKMGDLETPSSQKYNSYVEDFNTLEVQKATTTESILDGIIED